MSLNRVPDACCASAAPAEGAAALSRRWKRIAQALSRAGVEVRRQDGLWSFTAATAHGDVPLSCEVLLPDDLPLERKALEQLLTLARVRHPHGGRVDRCVATPDFHPGDSGIAIGSVVRTEGMLIPAAVGRDINCGMRLHVVDLPLERFLAHRDEVVALLRGDLLLGTRDLVMRQQAMAGALTGGLLGWLDALGDRTGSLADVDLGQVEAELERVYELGSLEGHLGHVPVDQLVGNGGLVRDQVLGTIGGGNHFIELQRVVEVFDGGAAWRWGVKEGQLAFMIHSGSRALGKAVGDLWKRRVVEAWPEGVVRQPTLSLHAGSPALEGYLEAERTAANYGFLNRQVLAELVRRRLRQVFGGLEAPLVFDLPHNFTEVDHHGGSEGWITRKGACPAHRGQPVIIPGSMGTSSYLMRGLGSRRLLASASHGAGRAVSRFELGRRGSRYTEEDLGLTGVDCITLKAERRIEEAPAAYKPITSVIEAQVAAGVVAPVARLEPILTFKG